ncbi:MAG: glycosyltransferase family 4 protein [Candidatus Bathyarchaeia archaeon]|jgi:glycosyltransferase involved in cell wall biosynthesis
MGGGATRASNMSNALVSNDCSVTVITSFPHYPKGNIPKKYRWKPLVIENENEIKVIRTFVPPLASTGLMRRVVLFLSFIIGCIYAMPLVGEIDVIWAGNPNVISVYPSIIYKIIKKKPIIQNVDDLWPESLIDLNWANKKILIFPLKIIAFITYSISSAITLISPAYSKILIDEYHVNPAKLSVIFAGVDLNVFNNKIEEKKSPFFRILYIGSFSPAYDFDQILNAAELLLPIHNVQFILQGGGELLPSIQKKVQERKLSNVNVVDKIVDRKKVAKILAEVDVLILPLGDFKYVETGISTKLFEYQAAQKAIICCSRGMHKEYILSTKSGIAVDPGDYKSLANAILFLKEHENLSEEYGLNGRRFVENNLTLKHIGLEMVNIINNLK